MLVAAAVTIMILAALVFLVVRSYEPLSTTAILTRSLTEIPGRSGACLVTPLLLVAAWLGVAFALSADELPTGATVGWANRWVRVLLIGGGAAVLFAFAKAARLSAINVLGGNSLVAIVEARLEAYQGIYIAFASVLLVLLLFQGTVSSGLPRRPQRRSSKLTMLVGLIASGALLAGAYQAGLKMVLANLASFYAGALHSGKTKGAGVLAVFERAMQTEPRCLLHRIRLGENLMEQAKETSDEREFGALIRRAEETFSQGQQPPNLNVCSVHVISVYSLWLSREKEPDAKLELATKASRACEKALIYAPDNSSVRNVSAYLDLTYLKQEARAIANYRRVVELDPGLEDAHVRFANHLAAKARAAQDKAERRNLAAQAISCFMKGAAASKKPASYHDSEVRLCADLGEPDLVLACYSNAREASLPAEVWSVEEGLAGVYRAWRNKAAALEHIREALRQAPPKFQAHLQQVKDELEQQP